MAQISLDARDKLTVRVTKDNEHDTVHLVIQMTEAGWTDTVTLWLGFGQEDAWRAAKVLEAAATQAREVAEG